MNWRRKRKQKRSEKEAAHTRRHNTDEQGKEGSHSGFLCAGAHGDQQGQSRLRE